LLCCVVLHNARRPAQVAAPLTGLISVNWRSWVSCATASSSQEYHFKHCETKRLSTCHCREGPGGILDLLALQLCISSWSSAGYIDKAVGNSAINNPIFLTPAIQYFTNLSGSPDRVLLDSLNLVSCSVDIT